MDKILYSHQRVPFLNTYLNAALIVCLMKQTLVCHQDWLHLVAMTRIVASAGLEGDKCGWCDIGVGASKIKPDLCYCFVSYFINQQMMTYM